LRASVQTPPRRPWSCESGQARRWSHDRSRQPRDRHQGAVINRRLLGGSPEWARAPSGLRLGWTCKPQSRPSVLLWSILRRQKEPTMTFLDRISAWTARRLKAPPPLTTEEVLRAEAEAIHPDADLGPVPREDLYKALNGLNSSAL